MRRLSLLAIPVLLAATACVDEAPTELEPQLHRGSAARAPGGQARYKVSLYNLTDGQPFTPPLSAVHRRPADLFEVGEPASVGVQQIAENGNLDPMLEALEDDRHVLDVQVTFGPTAPPVLPGQMVEFEVVSERGAKYLSIVSMLICTNDGFTGVDAIRLPRHIGRSTTVEASGYDAGTEINTEDFADMVPPCPALTGVDSDDSGTGMTDPALAEKGVIHHHPGISGDADLVPAIHGWDDPVAKIVIERIG